MEEKYMKLGDVLREISDLTAMVESMIEDEVCREICDNYCKFPNSFSSFDKLIEERCNSCPLTKWI